MNITGINILTIQLWGSLERQMKDKFTQIQTAITNLHVFGLIFTMLLLIEKLKRMWALMAAYSSCWDQTLKFSATGRSPLLPPSLFSLFMSWPICSDDQCPQVNAHMTHTAKKKKNAFIQETQGDWMHMCTKCVGILHEHTHTQLLFTEW